MNRQNLSSLILLFLFLLSLLSVVGLAKDGPSAAYAPSLRDAQRSTSPSTPDPATGAHTRSLVAEVVDVAAQAAGNPGQTVDKAIDPCRGVSDWSPRSPWRPIQFRRRCPGRQRAVYHR